jgi:hypothetical protein
MPGEIDGVDLPRKSIVAGRTFLLLVTSGDVTSKDEDLPNDGEFLPKPTVRPR